MDQIPELLQKHKYVVLVALLLGAAVGYWLFIRKKGTPAGSLPGLLTGTGAPYLDPAVYGTPTAAPAPVQTTPLPGSAPGTASTTADVPMPAGAVPTGTNLIAPNLLSGSPYPGTNIISPGSALALPLYVTTSGTIGTTPYGNPTTSAQGTGQQPGSFVPAPQLSSVVSNTYPGSVPYDPRLGQATPTLYPGYASVAQEAQSTNPDVFQNYLNIAGAIASGTAYAQSHGGTALYVAAGQPLEYHNSSGSIVDPGSWQPVHP